MVLISSEPQQTMEQRQLSQMQAKENHRPPLHQLDIHQNICTFYS